MDEALRSRTPTLTSTKLKPQNHPAVIGAGALRLGPIRTGETSWRGSSTEPSCCLQSVSSRFSSQRSLDRQRDHAVCGHAARVSWSAPHVCNHRLAWAKSSQRHSRHGAFHQELGLCRRCASRQLFVSSSRDRAYPSECAFVDARASHDRCCLRDSQWRGSFISGSRRSASACGVGTHAIGRTVLPARPAQASRSPLPSLR